LESGVPAGQPGAPESSPPASQEPAQQERQQRQETASAAQSAPPGVGVRRRLARLGAQRGSGVNPVLEPLVRTIRATHPKADIRMVERAYEVAAYWHRDQKRRSGDPYITHPLAVATILAELGMNTDTICAALLHDTVEDTQYTLVELRGEFGEDVAALVDGVTKLDKVKYGESAEAETVRKMVVAMSRDIRVLVIKLADRLHNMRTLRYMPRDKQERKSRETLEIFAPLAHRLGMNTIKWELEDLSFATLYPKRYDEIARLVSQRAPRRDVFLQEVIADLYEDLRDAKIKCFVTGRPKHYYSIYQKMIAHGVGFDEIYDLVGIRVLVDSVRDCYATLGTIHARWNPVPGRFKDYIAMPKFNMYQSLHTTVIGPGGRPVELQIRTWDMHKRAEYGVAAHWKYKEEAVFGQGRGTKDGGPKGAAKNPKDETTEMAWLRQLVDWQRETEDPAEFLDSLRFDLAGAEVYVFTPRGEVVALPQDSTPVDFAYAIHTEVGHRTIGARVNGRLVALESTLDNGDTVEIFTSKAQEAGPNRDWLNFVKSARARNKIRQWFSKERREAAVEAGKDQIAKVMRKQGMPLQRLMSADTLLAIAREHHYQDLSGLYAAVGEGRISAQSVVAKLVQMLGGMAGAEEDLAEATTPARAASAERGRLGRRGRRRLGCLGAAVQVLYAGAGRRDPGLCHARPRGLCAPRGLREPRPPHGDAEGADGHGALGAVRRLRVPRRHPGGSARPDQAAVRRDPGAVRPARQHPVRVRDDEQGPGGDQQVRLRDGRPQAPRRRPARGPRRRRRIRRLPGHQLVPRALVSRERDRLGGEFREGALGLFQPGAAGRQGL
jgi:GTP pyrophosphokinase